MFASTVSARATVSWLCVPSSRATKPTPQESCSNAGSYSPSPFCGLVRLSEGAAVSRQAITKHLHALEEAGLVRSNRDGRERIWELRTKRLNAVRRYLDQISTQWDEALVRLRVFVEKRER